MTHPTDHPPGTEAREEAVKRSSENMKAMLENIGKAFAEATETIGRAIQEAQERSHPAPDLARDSMEAFREQNFPSDLARDDDAQSAPEGEHTCHDHCPCQLRERAIRALAACDARWNDDTGDWDTPTSAYLAQMADAALSAVQPDRLLAEREASDKHADRLLDERDKWRREYSKERAQSRHFEEQRDTAQAEVKELRERLRECREYLRSRRTEEVGLCAERDALRTQFDEAAAIATRVYTERDALQARIDSTRHELLDWRRSPEERCKAAYNALIPDRDWEPIQSADYGSEARGFHWGGGQKHDGADSEQCHAPDCGPADDGSEAGDDNDAAKAAPWYCRCDSTDPCTCPDTAATAGRNPAFMSNVELSRVREYLGADDGSEAEDWRPSVGESVIRLGGAHEFPATVAEQRQDGTYLTHDQADGAEAVVTVEKLRPVGRRR